MTSFGERLKMFEERLKALEADLSESDDDDSDESQVNPLGEKYHNDTIALMQKRSNNAELNPCILSTRATTSFDNSSCTGDVTEVTCGNTISLTDLKRSQYGERLRQYPPRFGPCFKNIPEKIEEVSMCSKPSVLSSSNTATPEAVSKLEHSDTLKTESLVHKSYSGKMEKAEKPITKSLSDVTVHLSQLHISNTTSPASTKSSTTVLTLNSGQVAAQPTRLISCDSGRGSSIQSEPNQPGPSNKASVDHQTSPLVIQNHKRRKRTLCVSGKEYQILNVLGKGGSCVVYQVYSEETQICYAIKCVDLSDADEPVIKAYKNEIWLLKSLQATDRVVKLFDYEYDTNEQMLYVVMERGDSDLATFFKTSGENRLPALTVAFYWSEMLKAVQVVHKKGIVHSDLKPRNFLLVGGHLKLIDFGIANAVPNNKTSVTKECQMGTPNYMSPEALSSFDDSNRFKFKVSVKSDVWSLGCILYFMVYGKTPFQHLPNEYKIWAITNSRHNIEFKSIDDSQLLNVMQRCLQRDPRQRATVEELLNHPYLIREKFTNSNGLPPLSDQRINDLAEIASRNTPRSNAKLLRKFF